MRRIVFSDRRGWFGPFAVYYLHGRIRYTDEKMPRKRNLSKFSPEMRTDLSVRASNRHQSDAVQLFPNYESVEITACRDNPQICGTEAACRSFADNTSKCVCPHDLSSPTSNLRCPNRLIVPLTPRPIHNIIPPTVTSGNNTNSTNSTNVLPEAEQG